MHADRLSIIALLVSANFTGFRAIKMILSIDTLQNSDFLLSTFFGNFHLKTLCGGFMSFDLLLGHKILQEWA